MSKENSAIKKETLEEMEQRLINEIKSKEEVLANIKKKYYTAELEKDFLAFLNDKRYRDVEIPYELLNEIDELEKEIRILKNKLRQFERFKEQAEKDLE
ncbi:hypothetical protein [Tissierella sp.]|uniref:hypothetical protein n=1 Tax=Tissierella sp. TaxID=41274 RepID=UPI00285FD158|nr:hypothetical protein [Tissierella sp.]MDR7856320.1 hypothetical protein [Tissierella sp.]